jgi:CRISPR-associated protein Cas1
MAKVFYIFQSGSLKRKDNTLLFQNQDFKKFIPIEDVEELFLMGEISLNTKVLNFLSQNGIVTHIFNHYGWYSGSFYPREEKVSGYLLVKQVEKFLNPEERLFLAKKFVESSIRNSSKILKLESDEYLNQLEEAKTIEETMAVEANFRKEAYKRLEELTGWEFGKRSRRPPKNRLNALISFGNSLVYAKVLGEIYKISARKPFALAKG